MMGLFLTRTFASPVMCTSTNGRNRSHTLDASFIKRAAELADKSAGFTAPHPNFGCVIAVNSGSRVVGEGYLYAQGTKPAELLAVEAAGEYCKGATAYVNMEPGDCHGDSTAVSSFIKVFLMS